MTGHLTEGIKELCKDFESIKTFYDNKKLNRPSHEAARLALSSKSKFVWFTDFLITVLNAVNSDCLNEVYTYQK